MNRRVYLLVSKDYIYVTCECVCVCPLVYASCNIQFRCRETNDLIARRQQNVHLGRTEHDDDDGKHFATACKIQTARRVRLISAIHIFALYSMCLSLRSLTLQLYTCICKNTLTLYLAIACAIIATHKTYMHIQVCYRLCMCQIHIVA